MTKKGIMASPDLMYKILYLFEFKQKRSEISILPGNVVYRKED